MAKIKREDLEHFSNKELRNFYLIEDWRDLPEPMYSYVNEIYEKRGYVSNCLNRLENLMNIIVVSRFVKGDIN